MYYWLVLLGLVLFYATGIFTLKYVRKTAVCNLLFPTVTFLLYGYCVIATYIDVGGKDWNFLNMLPTANVSPFMFTLTFLALAFPKKLQKYIFRLVALLSFGLFCSGMLTTVFNALREYALYWTIVFDIVAHAVLSLFGIYLVKTEQVDLEIQNGLKSGALIVGVAVGMLLLNVIFHTSFFGLSLYGNHNIYNFVVCENGYLSAVIYFCGLCGILTVGYFYQKLLKKI